MEINSSVSEPCPDAAQQRWNWPSRPEYIAVRIVHGFVGAYLAILYKKSVLSARASRYLSTPLCKSVSVGALATKRRPPGSAGEAVEV